MVVQLISIPITIERLSMARSLFTRCEFEEALTIYKKYDQHAMAINVFVEHIVSIDRGLDYAVKVNRPEVWSRLAKSQLDGLRIKDSIGESFP